MRMYRHIASVLLLVSMLSAPARSEPGDFRVAPIGTRFFLTTGGFLEIASVDDKTVTTVNSIGQQAHWISLFFPLDTREGYQFKRAEAEALWPLVVGKKVQFDLSGRSASNRMGTWTNELRVLRTEKVKVPAGEFDTFVVEHHQHSTAGSYDGSTFYWYAPDAGFIIKTVYNFRHGIPGRTESWEVERIDGK